MNTDLLPLFLGAAFASLGLSALRLSRFMTKTDAGTAAAPAIATSPPYGSAELTLARDEHKTG